MKLVELIRGMASSEVYDLVERIAQKMGKQTVEGRDMRIYCKSDANAYINEAVEALYEGIGSVEDIDLAMSWGQMFL